MSISHQEAINEFIKDCSRKEYDFIRGHKAYMDARYLIKNYSNYLNSNKLLIEAIKYGTIRIKIRALIVLLRSFTKL